MVRLRSLARILTGIGVVALIALSVAPAPVIESVPPWMIFWDKLQHTIAYLGVAGCGATGFPDRRGRTTVALGLVALGLALEGVQHVLPTRSFEVADLGANTLGVVLGTGAALVFDRVVGVRLEPMPSRDDVETPT